MIFRRVMLSGALTVLAACGGGSGGSGPPQLPPVTPTMDVAVVNNQFSPPNAGVAVSSTVTWTWNSMGTDHNVRWGAVPAPVPHSLTQSSGTHMATFTTPGVYPYNCSIHVGMEGYVTVQ